MLVADLRHYLDVDDHASGPLRLQAEQLGLIVRAATSRHCGQRWVSAIACTRRPNRQPCLGHIELFATDVPAAINWQCDHCGDDGVITGWAGSPFDLRSTDTPASSLGRVIVVPADVIAMLRTVLVLDTQLERLVFSARVVPVGFWSKAPTATSWNLATPSPPKRTTRPTELDSGASTPRWTPSPRTRRRACPDDPGASRRGCRSSLVDTLVATRGGRRSGQAVRTTAPTPTAWTDHDVSDPGITLLKLVVDAIGALGIATATAAFLRTRRQTCEAGRSSRARA